MKTAAKNKPQPYFTPEHRAFLDLIAEMVARAVLRADAEKGKARHGK